MKYGKKNIILISRNGKQIACYRYLRGAMRRINFYALEHGDVSLISPHGADLVSVRYRADEIKATIHSPRTFRKLMLEGAR